MDEKHSLLDKGSESPINHGTISRTLRNSLTTRRSPKFSDNDKPTPNETWMSSVPNDVPISALSIPGTHDSAAYTSKWPFVSTQNLNITEQLNLGIRYFDLRCGLRANIVEMVHGISYLGLRLEEVLSAMYAWLETHASEGLVVQIKHDREDEKSSIDFSQGVMATLMLRQDKWRTTDTTPTLGELRGKIQLFRRFEGQGLHRYGIDVSRWVVNPEVPFTICTWHGVQITIQDHYTCASAESLPTLVRQKGGDVATMLKMAEVDVELEHWYLNFTSAYEINFWYQITPREIALGGWWGFNWDAGINVRLRNSLQRQPGKRRLGIIAMDYPEMGADDLVALVIRSNFESKGSYWERLLFVLPLLLLIAVLVAGVMLHVHGRNLRHGALS